MSKDQEPAENKRRRGPLSEDVHLTLISGPEEYGMRPEGAVRYIPYGNPAGVVGYLWTALDGSDNAGLIPSPAQGHRASNALGYWIRCMRKAKAKGLTPDKAVEWLLEEEAGRMPFPGRLLPESAGEMESLEALRARVYSQSKINTEELPELRIHAYSQLVDEPDGRKRLLAPEITYDMRESTELAPGKRMVAVDPEYPLYAALTDDVIIGLWQTNENGAFAEFTHNPRYKSTPTAVGIPRAENLPERAVQLRFLGRLTEEQFVSYLRPAQVLVRVGPDGRTPCRWRSEPDAEPVLLMYTGLRHAPDEGRNCRWMNAAEAAGLMTNLTIEINRGSGAGISIPASKVAVSDFG